MRKLILESVLVLVSCLAWFLAGWKVAQIEKRPAPEPSAPAIVQADGSMILERNPPKHRPKAPAIPSGTVVTRITTAEIELPECPKPGTDPHRVTVQLTQVQTAEGSRVIASTPSGQVIGGSDWTAPPAPPAPVYHWQAQAIRAWSPKGSAWGASLGYTRGRLVASVAVVPGPLSMVQAGIGFRW